MCSNGCGTEIHFEDSVRSKKSGKCIPLEGDNNPHNCPMSKYYKPKSTYKLFGLCQDNDGFHAFGNKIVHEKDIQFYKEKGWL